MDASLASVLETAGDIFEVDPTNLDISSSPETIATWDSVQHLNFILALESKFGIEVSPEEMEQLKCLGDAARIVKERTAAASS
jgi:acyl carrier protein